MKLIKEAEIIPMGWSFLAIWGYIAVIYRSNFKAPFNRQTDVYIVAMTWKWPFCSYTHHRNVWFS